MARSRKKVTGAIKGPFAAMEQDLLYSQAHRDLTPSAAKLYPLMRLQGGMNKHRGKNDFAFTYKDAEKRGFARATFSRAVRELVAKGLLVPTEYGGKRGFCLSENRFALSERWRFYGVNRREKLTHHRRPILTHLWHGKVSCVSPSNFWF